MADGADPERAVLRTPVGGRQPNHVPDPLETRRETGLQPRSGRVHFQGLTHQMAFWFKAKCCVKQMKMDLSSSCLALCDRLDH